MFRGYANTTTGTNTTIDQGDCNGIERWMLDTTFPMPCAYLEDDVLTVGVSSAPVNATLDSLDSPGEPLYAFVSPHLYNWYYRQDNFKTYLIYRPEGDEDSTIWVSLAVLDWGWYGLAFCNNTATNNWELDNGDIIGADVNGKVTNSLTSYLPEWTENIKDHQKWVTYPQN